MSKDVAGDESLEYDAVYQAFCKELGERGFPSRLNPPLTADQRTKLDGAIATLFKAFYDEAGLDRSGINNQDRTPSQQNEEPVAIGQFRDTLLALGHSKFSNKVACVEAAGALKDIATALFYSNQTPGVVSLVESERIAGKAIGKAKGRSQP